MKNLSFFLFQILFAILAVVFMIGTVVEFLIYLVKDHPFGWTLFICFIASLVVTVVMWRLAYISSIK